MRILSEVLSIGSKDSSLQGLSEKRFIVTGIVNYDIDLDYESNR